MEEKMITYLDIQRLSTEDGPGLRTTVFFKGCPLKCTWCHNPESISFKAEIICLEDRCMGCRLCEGVCPKNGRQKCEMNRELCEACGNCVEACPTAAIELKGTTMTAAMLCHELLRDKAYWGYAGGGTLSGGEAASQRAGTLELLRLLKAEGVHTALDTCGLAAGDAFKEFLPYVDLFLFDIKLIDKHLHRKYTGADNVVILENARFLHDSGAVMWIRTPVIPDATDNEDNIRGIGEFIGKYLPNVTRWELCSFNNLCRDKYRRLGKTYDFADSPLMAQEKMEKLCGIGRECFPDTIWTGVVL
jgi:pyruvate formate lyase activating enzyme